MTLPNDELRDIARQTERFEASPSRANTGTGSRSEGGQFENLVAEFWDALGDHLRGYDGVTEHPSLPSFRRFTSSDRSIYLPTARPARVVGSSPFGLTAPRTRWFECDFAVSDLVGSFSGEQQAIARYAPSVGAYTGANYPNMYGNRRTTFDDTIVLERDGVLAEKILLEYKTAKSSRGISIDGNAHERLSFQVLQYLEVATPYPRCSFFVFCNGAFAFYKNKYHVNFDIQAERLATFLWFSMDHYCTAPEYLRFVYRLIHWLTAAGEHSAGGGK